MLSNRICTSALAANDLSRLSTIDGEEGEQASEMMKDVVVHTWYLAEGTRYPMTSSVVGIS